MKEFSSKSQLIATKTEIKHNCIKARLQTRKTDLISQIMQEQSKIILRIPINHITRALNLLVIIRINTLVIRLSPTKTRTKNSHLTLYISQFKITHQSQLTTY
jgi:hypothetical protein